MKLIRVIKSTVHTDKHSVAKHCAERWYTENGYKVKSVSTTILPVDLICEKDGQRFVVQVLGSEGTMFTSRWKSSLKEKSNTALPEIVEHLQKVINSLNAKAVTFVAHLKRGKADLYIHNGILTRAYTIDGEFVGKTHYATIADGKSKEIDPDDVDLMLIEDTKKVTE